MIGGSSSAETKVIAALLRAMRLRRELGESPVADHANSAAPGLVRQREATFADANAILALKARCGLQRDSIENWYRLWRDNPVLALPGPRFSMGWVLETNGAVVGYLGNVARLYT